jgi:NADH-quinone oxidoreductase subunit L
MFRLLYLVFFGENRSANTHPHESPKVMTVPLMVLAVLSVIGGFLNIPALFGGSLGFSNYLQSAVASKTNEEMSHSTEIGLIVLSVVLLAGIIYWAYQTFVKKAEIPSGDEVELPTLPRIIANKFYIDEIYRAVFEKPFGYFSDFLFKKVESTVLAPAVEEVGTLTSQLGALTRKLQRGNMSFYLFAMVAGILLFVVFILLI